MSFTALKNMYLTSTLNYILFTIIYHVFQLTYIFYH